MKKFFPFFLLTVFCITACDSALKDDDDIIWDFLCHSVAIKVTDADGNSLVDVDAPNNVLANEPYVMYKDKKYELKLNGPGQREEVTRALPPSFRDFYIIQYTNGERALAFGEFSPSSSHNEPFTIHWGDGTQDEVTFSLYIEWKSKKEPIVHRAVSLNGGPIEEGAFSVHIIK